MHTDVITTVAGLEALSGEWDQLVSAVEEGLFLAPEWVLPWWRIYGEPRGAQLATVACRDDAGQLVGWAPLYRAADGYTLALLGSGGDTSPDPLNVLARPGREPEVAAALARLLASADAPAWEALSLADLGDCAPMTWALERALARQPGILAGRVPGAVCPYVELPDTSAALHARIGRKLRHNVTSRRRKLEARGARLYRWEEEADVAAGIARIGELHRRRFSARGQPHSFSTPAYLAFHQEVAARMHARGRLRLYALDLEGETVAMLYCFRLGERVYHFQSGFDPARSRDGLGQVLVAYALEQSLAEGARWFDFLKGEYAYKDDWATGRRGTVLLTAGRLGRRGLSHLARTLVRPRLGALVRRARSGAADASPVPPRELLKHAVAGSLYYSGLLGLGLRLLRRHDRHHRLFALAYHKVLPAPLAARSDALSIDDFRSQVRAFERLFAVVSAAEALDELEGRRRHPERYPLLITFDDGYENTVRYALPVLHGTGGGLPALLFVTTGLLGRGELIWPDEVTQRLLGSPHRELRLRVGPQEEVFRLDDEAARMATAIVFKRRLKRLPHPWFLALLEELRRTSNPPAPDESNRLLSWDEVRAAQALGLHIGSHASHHVILSRLPDEHIEREIAGSQEDLRQQLGAAARLFAYPNGTAADYDQRVQEAVAAAGFSHAFTMEPRLASERDDRLALPRLAPQRGPGYLVAFELFYTLLRERLGRALPTQAAQPAAMPVVITYPASPPAVEVRPASATSQPSFPSAFPSASPSASAAASGEAAPAATDLGNALL